MRDREPEARPAEAARGARVGLGEREEDVAQALGRDADARVPHGRDEPRGFAFEHDLHLDAAVARELHRVGDEVEEHLTETARVAAHGAGDARGDAQLKEVAAGVGGDAHEVDHLTHLGARVEYQGLQLDAARLDLRIVERVVEQREERLARGADRLDEISLVAREGRVEQERRHADHRVHGRADLVRHHREELALGPRGLVGALPQLALVLDRAGELALVARVLFVFATEEPRHHREHQRRGVDDEIEGVLRVERPEAAGVEPREALVGDLDDRGEGRETCAEERARDRGAWGEAAPVVEKRLRFGLRCHRPCQRRGRV